MFSHLYIFNFIVLLYLLYYSWYLMLEKDILGGKTLALEMFIMAKIKVSHQGHWINPYTLLNIIHIFNSIYECQLCKFKSLPEWNSILRAYYLLLIGLGSPASQTETVVTVSTSPSLVCISQEFIALRLQSPDTVSIYRHFINTMKRTPAGAFI